MWTLIFLPFIVQAVAIGLDEAVFHLKRGLPRWERIGHPVDTLSVIACLAFALYVPYAAEYIKFYVGLGILSCLMITKDEFVHKHHCPAAEQWLHALLFVNHSIMVTAMGLMWPRIHGAASPAWLPYPELLYGFLVVQGIAMVGFFLYQVIYWNFIYKGYIHDHQ
jgi:hypothetical protein